MFWGVILFTAGIFILLSVILSVTSPVWLIFGAIALVGGIVSLIKSFPNGLGFWEFVVAIIAAGLIEIGLKLIVASYRKEKW